MTTVFFIFVVPCIMRYSSEISPTLRRIKTQLLHLVGLISLLYDDGIALPCYIVTDLKLSGSGTVEDVHTL